MANALKEIEHAQRLCDHGDITIGEYFNLVEKWEDAEPVKHGRWVESWGGKWHSCSVCGGIPPFNFKGEDMPTNYCPHCGAKMDEVKE